MRFSPVKLFFFSSRGRHTRWPRDWIQTCALPISGVKALLATFGYDQVNVAKKPTIGVIATGTELLDVEDELEPGKIRNSNAYTICSQIKREIGRASCRERV